MHEMKFCIKNKFYFAAVILTCIIFVFMKSSNNFLLSAQLLYYVAVGRVLDKTGCLMIFGG